MTTVRFQEIKARKQVTLPCRVCGKKVKRAVTVIYTVNPFNKTKYGVPKSRKEVYEDAKTTVAADAEALVATGVMCRKCQEVTP
jgi:hypothetical protein